MGHAVSHIFKESVDAVTGGALSNKKANKERARRAEEEQRRLAQKEAQMALERNVESDLAKEQSSLTRIQEQTETAGESVVDEREFIDALKPIGEDEDEDKLIKAFKAKKGA